MGKARFTYHVVPGVVGRADAVENFLRKQGWQRQHPQGGEVVATHISRWENGEIRWITFTFCGNTLTVGRRD